MNSKYKQWQEEYDNRQPEEYWEESDDRCPNCNEETTWSLIDGVWTCDECWHQEVGLS